MKVNWFNKEDSDCVITLSKEDFKNGEFNLNLKLKDYKREVQKGDLIKFDLGSKLINPDRQFANEYRVLKVEGDMAYVVSMYELNNMGFGTSQEYNRNDIDRFLEEGFFPSINEESKKAIRSTFIAQDLYTWGSDKYNPNTYASTIDKYSKCIPCGQRYISLLSYNDILEYFDGEFSKQDIYKTFFKKEENGNGHSFWLRSARADYSARCWVVSGDFGYVAYSAYSDSFAVRPAFTVKLSNLKYEFVDEE